MRYEVRAIYRLEQSLTVVVKEGGNPREPADWLEIESEHDIDCSLYEVVAHEEVAS